MVGRPSIDSCFRISSSYLDGLVRAYSVCRAQWCVRWIVLFDRLVLSRLAVFFVAHLLVRFLNQRVGHVLTQECGSLSGLSGKDSFHFDDCGLQFEAAW
jgi:hypothetical protein